MAALGVVGLVLAATYVATRMALSYFAPPMGDTKPLKRETLTHIIQMECKTTGDRNFT